MNRLDGGGFGTGVIYYVKKPSDIPLETIVKMKNERVQASPTASLRNSPDHQSSENKSNSDRNMSRMTDETLRIDKNDGRCIHRSFRMVVSGLCDARALQAT